MSSPDRVLYAGKKLAVFANLAGWGGELELLAGLGEGGEDQVRPRSDLGQTSPTLPLDLSGTCFYILGAQSGPLRNVYSRNSVCHGQR